jgi:Fur family ferric uptake transcriptional regulator
MSRAFFNVSEEAIRGTGARVTRARVEVLAALLAAERALTHHEVEGRISRNPGIDRVTVYRVLEWLTSRGLAHKIAGDDRIWRFNAATNEHERAHAHAHFKCNRCGDVICLEEVRAARSIKLPPGFRSQEVELTVKGMCAECYPARKRA